jgi:phosphoglycerol transferase MdoB-like AlkP superfamily enzyme
LIIAIHFGFVLCLALIKAVKHGELGPRTSLGLEDWASALFLASVLGCVRDLAGPFAALLAASLNVTLMLGLWLDALLFRIFTIELGPGGVRSVVVTVLYRELAELSLARRFLLQHRWFSLTPLLVIAAHAPLFMDGESSVVALAVSSLVLIATAASAPPSLLRSFLFPRVYRVAPEFRALSEHEHLLELAPEAPAKSELFGRLKDHDVILVTIESMARNRVAAFADGPGARMPFLEELLRSGLRSEAHFCISPTTNNAHVALYASGYVSPTGRGLVREFARAGYDTIYVSPIRTEHYGLREILDGSGFDHVIDHAAFRPHALDAGIISDWVLPEQAPERIAEVRGDGPLLIHIHTVNTHVPYRVVDRERFVRHDQHDDLGRFLNGLEEADFLIRRTVERLVELRVVSSPIVAVTGDHGQAFGRLGYQSHGSAIIRDELDVPMIVHHPDLPSVVVPWSSHFDVLPTILDLVGIEHAEPCFGTSILAPDRRPELFLWAGHPSRSTTSNYGLLLEERKYMLDLVTEKCVESDWSDEDRRELEGDEKIYWSSLVSKMLQRLGLR